MYVVSVGHPHQAEDDIFEEQLRQAHIAAVIPTPSGQTIEMLRHEVYISP
jgi:hypothetical protein